MIQLPLYKKILSYLVPVQVRKSSNAENPVLELFFYRGQYQLATRDAIYSDGDRYRPINIAVKHLATSLPKIKHVLVLGTGLGSAVQVFAKKNYYPKFTLVDYDSTVMKWALEVMPRGLGKNITPVCADAQAFMMANKTLYDLLVVDIFSSRIVPAFATKPEFLQQCRNSINNGGHFVMNYMVQNNEDWQLIDASLREIFPKCYYVDDGINRIIIATV